jgi:hypothetical protein
MVDRAPHLYLLMLYKHGINHGFVNVKDLTPSSFNYFLPDKMLKAEGFKFFIWFAQRVLWFFPGSLYKNLLQLYRSLKYRQFIGIFIHLVHHAILSNQ